MPKKGIYFLAKPVLPPLSYHRRPIPLSFLFQPSSSLPPTVVGFARCQQVKQKSQTHQTSYTQKNQSPSHNHTTPTLKNLVTYINDFMPALHGGARVEL